MSITPQRKRHKKGGKGVPGCAKKMTIKERSFPKKEERK